ncbi:MAG: gliding motility protein GldL [Bacteroidales bacterium]
MSLNTMVQSPGYKKFMAKLYGWGASVVIIGALFKINHYEGANLMLILGMGTEAIIFFFSAFEPAHPQYDWSRIYPELGEGNEMGNASIASSTKKGKQLTTVPQNDALSQKLEEMLEKANISQDIFDRLGTGLQNLTETTSNINNVANIVNANNQYAAELGKMTAHLTKLNELYLTQMQASAKQMETSQKLNKDLDQIMETMSGSLDHSKKYRSEINDLSQKVASLNEMYGKMLAAMSAGKN